MYIPVIDAMAVQQTAMAADIFGIVFNDSALHDNVSNFAWRNHSIRSRHLANSVGEK